MKKNKITIKPEGSLESILCLGPVIEALKVRHPGAEVGVLAEECFREASAAVPGLDFFATHFDADSELYDFTSSSAESWGLESLDWKAYLQGCANTPANPYHQIDLFRKATHSDRQDVNFDLIAPPCEESSLPASLTGGDTLRISLCASSLGINELQATLEGIALVNTPVTVHLLGTVSDRRKSSILLSAWEGRINLIDLCGRQSFAQYASSLKLTDIAITGPGASAIVSSGFGTFTLCVDEDRNPLHYPYGHGHLILQGGESDEFCSALTGLVPEIVQFALSGGDGSVPTINQWQHFADERVDNFLSHIRLLISQRIETLEQEGSFTELYIKPLIFLGADQTDVMQSFYRLLWENSLEGREISTGDLSVLHQEVIPALSAALRPLEQLYEIANFGRTYSSFIRESLIKSDLAGAKHNATRLQETEELVHLLAKSTPLIAPLAQYHAKRQRLHIETDTSELSDQMIRDFSNMQGRVLVLLDLTKTLFHTTLQNEAPIAAPKEGPLNG